MKADEIRKAFDEGFKLREIRERVFPELSVLKPPESYQKQREVNDEILAALGCKDWDDYKRLQAKRTAKKRYSRVGSEGRKAKKLALERDGHRCVITGVTENIHVHHIDGDITNYALNNLVTLYSEVHKAVTKGANGLTDGGITIRYGSSDPRYADFLRMRIRYIHAYVEHLHKMGYDEARVERHARGTRHYWVSVLKPTGLHQEVGTDSWDKYGYFDEDDAYEDEEETLQIYDPESYGTEEALIENVKRWAEIEGEQTGLLGEPVKCPKCGEEAFGEYVHVGRGHDGILRYHECTDCGFKTS